MPIHESVGEATVVVLKALAPGGVCRHSDLVPRRVVDVQDHPDVGYVVALVQLDVDPVVRRHVEGEPVSGV